MIKMTYDEFENLCSKLDELPDVISEGRGLTESDLNRLKSDPVKYMPMILYYESRNFANDESFSNSDAIPGDRIKAELNKLIKDNIIFTD